MRHDVVRPHRTHPAHRLRPDLRGAAMTVLHVVMAWLILNEIVLAWMLAA